MGLTTSSCCDAEVRISRSGKRICTECEMYCDDVSDRLNELASHIHRLNAKFWLDLETGEPIKRDVQAALVKAAMAHSEISEAVEGFRKDLMDDKLPHRKMAEVEIADAIIRLLDLAHAFGFDIGGAIVEKLEFNKTRADHSDEERKKSNGKKV